VADFGIFFFGEVQWTFHIEYLYFNGGIAPIISVNKNTEYVLYLYLCTV